MVSKNCHLVRLQAVRQTCPSLTKQQTWWWGWGLRGRIRRRKNLYFFFAKSTGFVLDKRGGVGGVG